MIVHLPDDHDRHRMNVSITWTCGHLPAVEHFGYEGIETFFLAGESILVIK